MTRTQGRSKSLAEHCSRVRGGGAPFSAKSYGSVSIAEHGGRLPARQLQRYPAPAPLSPEVSRRCPIVPLGFLVSAILAVERGDSRRLVS